MLPLDTLVALVSGKNNVQKPYAWLVVEMPRVWLWLQIMRDVHKNPQDALLRRPVAEQKGSGPCIMAERLKSCRVARFDGIVVAKQSRVPMLGAFGRCWWHQTSLSFVVQSWYWYIPEIDGSIHNMTYFVGPLVQYF